MNCIVLDHAGAVMCQAVLHEFTTTKEGVEWATLTNKQTGKLFYATVDRIRNALTFEKPSSKKPLSKKVDDEFIDTVMEFLLSGAKSIEHFHFMDKAHPRRVHPNPAWFK